jgi:hypothetical protein
MILVSITAILPYEICCGIVSGRKGSVFQFILIYPLLVELYWLILTFDQR